MGGGCLQGVVEVANFHESTTTKYTKWRTRTRTTTTTPWSISLLTANTTKCHHILSKWFSKNRQNKRISDEPTMTTTRVQGRVSAFNPAYVHNTSVTMLNFGCPSLLRDEIYVGMDEQDDQGVRWIQENGVTVSRAQSRKISPETQHTGRECATPRLNEQKRGEFQISLTGWGYIKEFTWDEYLPETMVAEPYTQEGRERAKEIHWHRLTSACQGGLSPRWSEIQVEMFNFQDALEHMLPDNLPKVLMKDLGAINFGAAQL